LAELSEVCPEIRMGQLVVNLSYLARGPAVESVWDMEDGVAGSRPETPRAMAHAASGDRLASCVLVD